MSFQEFGTFGDQFCNVDVRHLFAFRPEADRSVFLLVLYAVIWGVPPKEDPPLGVTGKSITCLRLRRYLTELRSTRKP